MQSTKEKRTNDQKHMYKTLRKKLKIEGQESHETSVVNLGSAKG